MTHTSVLGDPIGAPMPEEWSPPPRPAREVIEGRYVRLEPLNAERHGDDLFAAFSEDTNGANWTYRLQEPFSDRATFDAWLHEIESEDDLIYFAYVDLASGQALGNGALMSITPSQGSLEVGSIMFSPCMQGTRAGTEAMLLSMRLAFSLGYRRFEWTCDPLNAASMHAAQRLGFNFEAVFRNAYVTKGRNRDKAVFACIDTEWPELERAYTRWLDPENFNTQGQQRERLSNLTAPILKSRGQIASSPRQNDLGQQIGAAVPGWTSPPRPIREVVEGKIVRLEPLAMTHAKDLYAANRMDGTGRNWTYLPYGPYDRLEAYQGWVDEMAQGNDPIFYTVVNRKTGQAIGVASYLRIDPASGSIEVGHINFSPLLQRQPGATEAMYLMMKWAFEAGYRRYEWKCDALNGPSRRAAMRLGLSYEGVFRQATTYSGRNRDTAWYATIDTEWPALKTAFETWLDPANFDAEGQQKQSLSTLTRPILVNIA